jgi:hypothetical protein
MPDMKSTAIITGILYNIVVTAFVAGSKSYVPGFFGRIITLLLLARIPLIRA